MVARGQVTVADPAFFGVSGTVARRNGAVGSYLMAHISAMPGFSIEVGIVGGSCNGMSICEVVECV
jgi:hypothetical protein